MKLGVFTHVFGEKPFEEILDNVSELGLDAIEIGVGGYLKSSFCDPKEMLENPEKLKSFKKTIDDRGISISALSCHGNPLAPDKKFAKHSHDSFLDTVRLAEQLEVPVVNCFSGTAGGCEGDSTVNWPVARWPHDFQDILSWQWKEKLIPYWKETGKFAAKHNIKVAIELHGGFLVHSPAQLLRIREEAGEMIGANLDPSHLWWQGIDPVAAIKILGAHNAIHHFHAKDTYIDQDNLNMHGLFDMQNSQDITQRAWYFRTVGYGHDLTVWSDIINSLKGVGYDHAVSIEHEDRLMSIEDGLQKAVENLRKVL